jgi:RNA polymerase sigma-70 factor (ECF subfamily)
MPFPTTQWSLVTDAGRANDSRAESAMNELCRRYWQPVNRFLCQRGYSEAEAEDLTQDFMFQMLESAAWRRVDPARGRFRGFLLGALVRFLHDEAARRASLKRGGGTSPVSLDAEGAPTDLIGPNLTEEIIRNFDRVWAVSLLAAAVERVRIQYAESGRAHVFSRLKPFLPSGGDAPSYEHTATALSLTLPALKTEVFRLRQAVRLALRAEVAQTVSAPHEVDAELSWLRRILMDRGSQLDPRPEKAAPGSEGIGDSAPKDPAKD